MSHVLSPVSMVLAVGMNTTDVSDGGFERSQRKTSARDEFEIPFEVRRSFIVSNLE